MGDSLDLDAMRRDGIDLDRLMRLADSNPIALREVAFRVLGDRTALLAEVERLRAKLDEPCGSCHPCVNWVDEEWRRVGRKPPYPYEWDAALKMHQAADAYAVAWHALAEFRPSDAGRLGEMADAQRTTREALIVAVDEWRASRGE